MNHLSIVLGIYSHFVGLLNGGEIPINLRAPSLVGTVQDDPFDSWIADEIKKALPTLEIVHVGSLTTPDILLRDKNTGAILGLEVKKLIQKPSGADARGLTLDYNSCLPCGQALIKVGRDAVAIPCYYLFALLKGNSSSIVTMILMDGDCLNYDFDLHKQAKISNISEYAHGPYGEGSVRRRAMYTYPNPLNSKLVFFHLRKILVIKKYHADSINVSACTTQVIRRDDIYGNSFHYSIIDYTVPPINGEPPLLMDIFKECKERQQKERTPSVPMLGVL